MLVTVILSHKLQISVLCSIIPAWADPSLVSKNFSNPGRRVLSVHSSGIEIQRAPHGLYNLGKILKRLF